MGANPIHPKPTSRMIDKLMGDSVRIAEEY